MLRTLHFEFNNILQWAQRNKIVLNVGKTKEIVFVTQEYVSQIFSLLLEIQN
jgi:hypothetical protein